MRALRNLLALLGVGVLVGLTLTVLVLPLAVPAAVATREGVRVYQSLPAELVEPPLPARSVVLAADGTQIAELYSYNRRQVPLEAIAPVLRNAVIAVEDARFYEHNGVDVRGIARAVKTNTATGSSQGGSTLTQQYVKNALALSAELVGDSGGIDDATEQSYGRKAREAKLALEVEAKYSKDEILAKYLNIAYFGSGAYGVEAAGQRYFGVPAADLDASQAAMLTGLLKNPVGYDPLNHPQAAADRRNVVLDRMADQGVITTAEADAAKAGPVVVNPTKPANGCAAGPAPFFCDYVRQVLETDPAFGPTPQARKQLLVVGGLTIRTTLDLAAQKVADAATASTVPPTHRVATAVAVVTPGTGHVRALATNRVFGSDGPGRTEVLLPTVSAFQPGSTFKPFTLAAALEAGVPLSTRLPGGGRYTSRMFDNPASGGYTNSSEGGEANVTLTRATQLSMNTAFIQLEEKVGVRAVAEMANRLGVTSLPYTGPDAPGEREGALTLGTEDVSVLEMANAYATLAAHGKGCPAVVVTAVTTRAGQELPVPSTGCSQVLDSAVADTVAAVLGTVVTDGTGKAAAFGRPAAGKTGTTQNAAASWFAGFTPQNAAAVWVGDPRGLKYPLRNVLGHREVYGGTVPAAVWRKTMAGVHAGVPVAALPTVDPAAAATGSGAVLPAVVGLPVEQATARLGQPASVTVQVTVRHVPARNDAQVPGTVAAMTPAAGTPLPRGPLQVTLDVVK